MKKSVRNIVSLITSTCLVASLGVVSVNADDLELVDSVASNDTVVEQDSSSSSSSNTTSNSTSSTVATTQAVTSTSSNNVVADTTAAETIADVTEAVVSSTNVALATDGDVTVAEDDDLNLDLDEDGEVLDTEDSEEDALVTTAATTNGNVVTTSATTTKTNQGNLIIPVENDGVEVEITSAIVNTVVEAPVTKDIILTLDTSNSMNGTPKELVKETATQLVNKILSNDENARIALVGFNNESYHIYSYDDETGEYVTYFDNAEDLIQAISDILDETVDLDADYLSGDGSTSLLNALYEVKFLLETSDGDEKSVVIMTDGLQGTNLMDEYGNVDSDIPNRYVFGEDYATAEKDSIIQFANDELKPLATIYAVGYFQNLSKADADDARDFLKELASDGNDGTRYYEANGKNIDEITDLITQDIVHKAIKDAPSNDSNSSSDSSEDTSDSPKTSDTGVAPIMMVSALAGAMLLFTKKKNK